MGVFMVVADVERSQRFYEELGATFVRRDQRDGAAYLDLGGVELCLHPGHERLQKLTIGVADHERVLARLRDAELTPRNQPVGHNHVLDPDGYEFDIFTTG